MRSVIEFKSDSSSHILYSLPVCLFVCPFDFPSVFFTHTHRRVRAHEEAQVDNVLSAPFSRTSRPSGLSRLRLGSTRHSWRPTPKHDPGGPRSPAWRVRELGPVDEWSNVHQPNCALVLCSQQASRLCILPPPSPRVVHVYLLLRCKSAKKHGTT